MKTRMKVILTSLLLILACPFAASAATGAAGELAAKGTDVNVSLKMPQGETEIITSMRLWLYVKVDSGAIKEPAFTFNKSITSDVKDAEIRKDGSGYIVDLIFSGKKSQDIFSGKDGASLGTLSLASANDKAFSATVGIAGEDGLAENKEKPVVKYVNVSGIEALTIPLADNAAAKVQGKDKEEPKTPEKKLAAVKSFSVQYQNTKKVAMTWKKVSGAEGYQIWRSTKKNGKYKLVKTVKKGSAVKAGGVKHKDGDIYYYKIRAYRTGTGGNKLYGDYSSPVRAVVAAPRVGCKVENGRLTIKWSELSRADGYVIYRYNAKSKSYKKLASVSGKKNTIYTSKFTAGSTPDIKVRGYEKVKGKSRIYGKYSVIVKYKSDLEMSGKVTAKSKRKEQATISWKKAGGADGYQVYRSTKKDGTYKRVETLRGNAEVKLVDEDLKSKKTYYYKVRAYRKGAGKKVYGRFSSAVSVKVK